MKSYNTRKCEKNNYYGLKNGQFLGCDPGRKENYIFKIFSDGSSCVEVFGYNGEYSCIFGGLDHMKRLYKLGHLGKYAMLTDAFIYALLNY